MDITVDNVFPDGPSSNPTPPSKALIRSYFRQFETAVDAGLFNGGLIYDTKANLDADLAHDANASAWVIADGTVANNGIYRKSGASGSGSWTRIADLPYSFIRASNAGAGTANAIQATTPIPIPAGDLAAKINLNITANNTGPATVAFNGGSALPIKTNSGADVQADYLVEGGYIEGFIVVGTFRLTTDVGTAADRAAAEAAADRAEDAAGSIDYIAVADLAALRAVDTAAHSFVVVKDSARFGFFSWNASDLSGTLLGPDIVCTVDGGTDTASSTAHGLMTGQAVIVTTAENGLSTNTPYYVISPVDDDDNFQLAASFTDAQEGIAIDLTASSGMTIKHHRDVLQGVYVTPASDISGASGAWVRKLDGSKITPRMFGAAGDNSGDDTHPWCAAADILRANINTAENISLLDLDGEGLLYKHNYSLNFTQIKARSASIVNAEFNSCCADEIALDFTASQFLYTDNLVDTGDDTYIPDVGFWFSRADDGGALPFPTSQDNTIGTIETLGTFKKFGFGNLASEVMHIDTLRASNNYYDVSASASVFTGNSAAISTKYGMPVSKYQKIGEGSQSLSSVIIDSHNARRNPAYGYAITGISATNPVVVTISPTNAAAGAASFGLANGASVFLDSVTGPNSAWAALLSFKVFTVASLDTGAGTFALSGVDGSALTGTWSAGSGHTGIVRNNTGAPTHYAQLGHFKEAGGYKTGYSDHLIRFDAHHVTDWNWGPILISGRYETASDHLVKFIGNGLDNQVRNVRFESDNSNVRVSPYTTGGVTGSGKISFHNLESVFSHAAQTPTSGLFKDPSVINLYGGRQIVPDASFINDKSSYSLSTSRWEYGNGLVRDDGLGPLRQSAIAVSHTGDTSETTLATIPIPAGYMGANDRLVIKTLWSFTGSTNNKTLKVKLNTTAYLNQVVNGATLTSARHITEINAVNSTSSQKGGPYGLDGYGEIALSLSTSTFNMANAQSITITGQLANSGETVTLEAYSVELIRQ